MQQNQPATEFPVSVRDIVISDPCVLAVPEEGRYFIYARHFDRNVFPEVKGDAAFYAFESPDLIHWSRPFKVFEKGDDFWADLDYWAPECHAYNGKYYIFSTFRAEGTYRRCQALVADSPRGPFAPIEAEPLTPPGWQCLDGTLYVDRKGQPWIVFCHEWLQVNDGQICAVPISQDLGHAVGDPVILFRASDAPWRGTSLRPGEHSGLVTDGCWLHRMDNGQLIMLWSNFSPRGYTTGYARSLSGDILGPWVQEPEAIYSMDGAHSMLFRDFDGQLVMSLHCSNTHHLKKMLLFEMEEKNGKLAIINEITGNWADGIGGHVMNLKRRLPLKELPARTRLGKYRIF